MRFVDQYQGKHDVKLLVGPGNGLSQSFISEQNNLAGIRLFVFNAKLGGKKEYLISISKNNEILRQQTFSESNVGWEMVFRYVFDPIESQVNDKFILNIDSRDSDVTDVPKLTMINQSRTDLNKINLIENLSSNQVDEIDAKHLQITYSKKNLYAKGSARLNDTELPGDLVFETYYVTNPSTAIRHAVGNTLSRMQVDRSFFFFYFLLLAIIIFAIFRSVLKKNGGR